MKKNLTVAFLAAVAIVFCFSVSTQAATIDYDGAWYPADQRNAYFLEFDRASSDISLYMYDYDTGPTDNDLLVVSNPTGRDSQQVWFILDNGTWYAGLEEGDKDLTLGSTPEFGFYFQDGSGNKYLLYEIEEDPNGGGTAWTLISKESGWEVSASDISPVPIPAGVLLFGSGLVSLAGIRRRIR